MFTLDAFPAVMVPGLFTLDEGVALATFADMSLVNESYLPSPEYFTDISCSPAVKFEIGTLAVPFTTGTVISLPSTLTVRLPPASLGKSIDTTLSPVVSSSGTPISGVTTTSELEPDAAYFLSPEYTADISCSPMDKLPNGMLAVPFTTGTTTVSLSSIVTVTLPVASLGNLMEISPPLYGISSGMSILASTLISLETVFAGYLSSPE